MQHSFFTNCTQTDAWRQVQFNTFISFVINNIVWTGHHNCKAIRRILRDHVPLSVWTAVSPMELRALCKLFNFNSGGVTAFCVLPCYLFPWTLGTSVVCSPLPTPWNNSVLCVPHSCTTCLLLDFFVLIIVQMNESLDDNIVKSINMYYEGRQKSIR